MRKGDSPTGAAFNGVVGNQRGGGVSTCGRVAVLGTVLLWGKQHSILHSEQYSFEGSIDSGGSMWGKGGVIHQKQGSGGWGARVFCHMDRDKFAEPVKLPVDLMILGLSCCERWADGVKCHGQWSELGPFSFSRISFFRTFIRNQCWELAHCHFPG